MGKKQSDISLISKYLKGELDARAMHRLEQRALDDPLLMDALEGYEAGNHDQQANLNDIGQRLQQRVALKERRIIPWRTLTIAASILVVFSVGWLVFYNKPADKIAVTLQKAELIKPPVAKPADIAIAAVADTVAKPAQKTVLKMNKMPPPVIVADAKAKSIVADHTQDILANAAISSSKPAAVLKDTTPLDEMVVMGYTAQKKKTDSISATDKKIAALKDTSRGTITRELKGQVDGLTKQEAPKPDYNFNTSIRRMLSGRVIDKKEGLPLPGVSVKIAGTAVGTVTDSNGMFNLPVKSKEAKLNVGYIGYQSQKVAVTGNDSLKTIAMVPSGSSLNEVVVVSADGKTNKQEEKSAVIAAHPVNGWVNFKKYLKKNAALPDASTGVVKLSFTVTPDGSLTDIKVIKSLSSSADEVATNLLTNGGKWIANTNGQPESVTISIKFGK